MGLMPGQRAKPLQPAASEGGASIGRNASTISLDDIDAWVFDLDGVLTDTAELHQKAWTQLFDDLFASLRDGTATPPPARFCREDYLNLVDGEDRTDGVRNVLRDRGIVLPEGDDDPAGLGTVAGLAKKKDEIYLSI